MNWFVTALKNYAVFSGRSRRSEYWYFGLFYLIFYGAAAVVDVVFMCQDSEPGANRFGANPNALSPARSFAPAKSWSAPQAKR